MSLVVNYNLKSCKNFLEPSVNNLKNVALFKALKENDKNGTLIGIRNGIAIIEDPYKHHYGTTNVRKFFGLNENGELVNLKDKAIYKKLPTNDDLRLLLGKWEYNYKNDTMTMRNCEVRNGVTQNLNIAKDKNTSNIVEQMFYYLPKSNMKSNYTYDYSRGIYRKCIQDNLGKLGVSTEYGKLIKDENGKFKEVKEARVSYNPALGNLGEPYKYMTYWGRMEYLDNGNREFFWR